jgi:chromatin assembly factor 1 subunit B
VQIWKVQHQSPGEATEEAANDGANEECPDVTFQSELVRHTGAVNCVRFSPNGKLLASASDDHSVVIWGLDPNGTVGSAPAFGSEAAVENEESWRALATLRGHREDVYDVAWNPLSNQILTGSVDNTAIVWDVSDLSKPKKLQHLTDHKHFVQGVAWNPTGENFATQSSDRSFRVYQQNAKRTKFLCAATTTKRTFEDPNAPSQATSEEVGGGTAAVEHANAASASANDTVDAAMEVSGAALSSAEDAVAPAVVVGAAAMETAVDDTSAPTSAPLPSAATEPRLGSASTTDGIAMPTAPLPLAPAAPVKKMLSERLFVDESRTTFFRRLAYTPDGSLLITAAGRHTGEDGVETYAAYIFRSSMPDTAVVRLAGMETPVVCARPCPLFFEKTPPKEGEATTPLFANLEHRMVFAIATAESVIIYDTEQLAPFAVVANLHFAEITDLSWSADGRILAISSQDGYCSMVAFAQGELGTVSATASPLMSEPALPIVDVAEEAASAASAASSPAKQQQQQQQQQSATAAVVASPPPSSSSSSPSKVQPRRIAPMLVKSASKPAGESAVTGGGPRRITPQLLTVIAKTSGVKHGRDEGGAAAAATTTAEQPPAKARRITPQMVTTKPSASKRIAPMLIKQATATATAATTTTTTPPPSAAATVATATTPSHVTTAPRRVIPTPL